MLLLAALTASPGAVLAKDKKPGHAFTPSKPKAETCKSITGTMKVRIIALRQKPIAPTTLVARGIQSVAKPIFGGTDYGTNQDAQRAADLQLVEAYNKRLVENNCPSFDLAAALAPGATESPRPTIPAAGKAAAKPAAPTKP